jgi:aminobenzoyl-glutamate utilization protein A
MAMNASEDCTTFLNRVTARGGKGIYMMYGAELAAGHHNDRFDFDESVISHAAAFLLALTLRYCS